jgi:rod shape-determining protein MreC
MKCIAGSPARFTRGLLARRMLQSSYAQELQQRLVELESQNRSLRQIVEGDSSLSVAEGTPAAVIGRSAGDWWQQIIISRGAQDGITPDDVVTGPGGLVGRVIAVSPNSSRVLLVSDPTSRVGHALVGVEPLATFRAPWGNKW